MEMEKKVPSLPNAPGIYLFKDAANTIIYIGKANSLRTRVRSYFRASPSDWKVQALIQEHATIDVILTKSELEALLLEAELIKEHKPKYNVLLKTGQPFLYIVFTKTELPTIELVRNKTKRGMYFGPFLHKSQTRSAYRYLMQTFRLMLCNKKINHGCLDYHIGLCAGNCMTTFNKEDYVFRLQLAQHALTSNHTAFLKKLKAQIAEYNRLLAFEKSQQLNEYLHNLDIIFATIRTKFSRAKFEHEISAATAPKQHVSMLAQAGTAELQQFLQLNHPISTIDCFDISHFQSSYLVGSCIRFKDGIPDKNNFRRFKIKTLTEQNDYAALQEIVTRRYRDPQDLPDLVLIDGGKGQLNAITPLLPTTPCISLAKREETIFSKQFPEGIALDIRTPVGQLLIALRDYAHHFAIQYHRYRRATDLTRQKKLLLNQ